MADVEIRDVRVIPGAVDAIARGPDVYAFVQGLVDEAAATMREGAPVRTGAGRASIRGQVWMGPDGWFGTASWDVQHYYMGIQNDRRHFVEPALSRVRYV
jgi:hypothetical protein